jgi:hypothetical protein
MSDLSWQSADRRHERKVYVGVDLVAERVTSIAVVPDLVRDAYLLDGEIVDPGSAGPTTIQLRDDDTDDGRRAVEIATSQTEPVGLGWLFVSGREKP